MTTFEKTWGQDNNRVPLQDTIANQCKYMPWYVKAFLKGEIGGVGAGLWTCAGSSDSSTSNMTGTDLWTASFDGTKIVQAAPASPHSWIVLQSPAGIGPFYMCIDMNTATTYQMAIFFSKTAFTGGSTSARPTSTTEWGYTGQQFTNNTLTAAHMHAILATTGDFHIRFSQDATGQFRTAISFFTLNDTKAGEAHNGFSYVEYASSGGAWFRTAYNAANNALLKGRNSTNTAQVSACIQVPCLAGTNMFGANEMATYDATDGKLDDFPAYLFADQIGYRSLRGRIPDILLAPELAAPGLTEPSSGPPFQTCIVGNTWQPWNASVAPIL